MDGFGAYFLFVGTFAVRSYGFTLQTENLHPNPSHQGKMVDMAHNSRLWSRRTILYAFNHKATILHPNPSHQTEMVG